LIDTLKDKNIKLVNRVKYLEGIIEENLPSFKIPNNHDNDAIEDDDNVIFKTVPQHYPASSKMNDYGVHANDLEKLQTEILDYREKAESLKFENERLQKLLVDSGTSSKYKSDISLGLESVFSESQTPSQHESPLQKRQPFSRKSVKSDSLIKNFLELEIEDELTQLFTEKMKSLGLDSRSQSSLRTVFKKLEERNMVLKSKIREMKQLMADLMNNFKTLVSKDYEDLEYLQREIMMRATPPKKDNSLEQHSELAKLLSIYSTENRELKE